MRKERIPRLDQEINYITEKQLKFIYSIMAFSVIMICTVLFGKISYHKKRVFFGTNSRQRSQFGNIRLKSAQKSGKKQIVRSK